MKISEAQAQLDEAKEAARIAWQVGYVHTSVINDQFISYKCKDILEMQQVLNEREPYVTGYQIVHGNDTCTIGCPYKVELINGYHERELRISFEMINGIKIWVSIEVKNLPAEFVEEFLVETTRGLYSTEQVYVNVPHQYKKFQRIRVPSFNFREESLGWHGGNKTLICTQELWWTVNQIKEGEK